MKKKYLFIIIIFILIDILILIFTFTNKKKTETIRSDIEVVDLGKLTFEYDEKIYLKDLIKNDTQGMIDTETLGSHTFAILNRNDNKKIYKISYSVVDSTPPLIIGSTTKTTTKGKDIDLVNGYLCGDNYDSKPNCYIEGDYNINKVGTYELKYIAEDSNGNKNSKDIKLNVINKSSSSSSSSTKSKTPFQDYISKYKNDNTKIGIDVSAWQDSINWSKVKSNGVEFAMLRIGYGPSGNELKLDKRFKEYIKGAKEAEIPIGLYFYSYAKTKEEAIEQAQWIISELDGEMLELPIAFDWENWNTFNNYNVSFKELSDIAQAFIDEIEKNGYKGMLYSSAYYLNHIWRDFDSTWLAYYTSNNDYEKSYIMWQLSSSGSVSGINGAVDIDILYNDKNSH